MSQPAGPTAQRHTGTEDFFRTKGEAAYASNTSFQVREPRLNSAESLLDEPMLCSDEALRLESNSSEASRGVLSGSSD